MPEAVAGQFVATLANLANDARKALRYPSQDKEGRFHLVAVKHFQQAMAILYYAAGILISAFS